MMLEFKAKNTMFYMEGLNDYKLCSTMVAIISLLFSSHSTAQLYRVGVRSYLDYYISCVF